MWYKCVLVTAQEKQMSPPMLLQNKNLILMKLAFCTPSHNKRLDLSISAEIGAKISREP